MDKKYTREYICELLEKAKVADPTLQIFGASKHKYQLNPPVSREEVAALEGDFNIKLPEDYVYFLTEIGNGGAGPYYGLYSLEELRKRQYCKRQDEKKPLVIDSSLSKETWNALMEEMDTGDDDKYDELEEQINTGVFIIGTQGCTYDNLLMCSGSETGKMVYIDWNLEYDYPPVLTKMSFWDWYTGFFEDIIAGYSIRSYGYYRRGTERELQEEFRKSLTLSDKLSVLQGFMRFDKLSAETIDFLYNIQDAQADSARLSLLLKFHSDSAFKLFEQFINGANIPAAVANIRRIPKELQCKYYTRAVEIMRQGCECDKRILKAFIGEQERK